MGIYNASINMNEENSVRTVLGAVAAATMKIKNYGYSDEAVYEIVPLVVGVEIKADQERIDHVEHILEAIHQLDESEEMFIRNLKDIMRGKE
jgi:hemoglobin-like flavoprotein